MQVEKEDAHFGVNAELEDRVIAMAWADRVTFEEIYEKTGLQEAEVIKVMRARLKPRSFELWRKRVSGRVTKHRKLFRKSRGELRTRDYLNDLSA